MSWPETLGFTGSVLGVVLDWVWRLIVLMAAIRVLWGKE